jgi:hypothetical protein
MWYGNGIRISIGVRNMYRYSREREEKYQMRNGVCGLNIEEEY